VLEFGTELVAAVDKSIVALLDASPDTSTAASIAVSVLEKCFASKLTESGWLPKLKQIIRHTGSISRGMPTPAARPAQRLRPF
jgi:malate dehydrogenase (quinone)